MIAVECFADEALVRACGVPKARIVHAKSKGDVVNRVVKASGAASGMVDEDPGSSRPRDMERFDVLEKAGSILCLRLRGDQEKHLVVVRPRLEEWLLARARLSGLGVGDYGLPEDARALHARRRYEKHPHFPAFLRALLDADPDVQQLREWVLGVR